MAPKREPLTMEDREDISRGLAKGVDNKAIALSIGRDESVVSREITRHGGRMPRGTAAGCAVTPATCNLRVPCSINTSTYSRWSSTVSTTRK